MISRENTLYVGTKAGVYRQENNRFIPLDNQLRNESVTALMQDSNDDIWIGTTNHGVFRYSDNGIEKLDDNIMEIILDTMYIMQLLSTINNSCCFDE